MQKDGFNTSLHKKDLFKTKTHTKLSAQFIVCFTEFLVKQETIAQFSFQFADVYVPNILLETNSIFGHYFFLFARLCFINFFIIYFEIHNFFLIVQINDTNRDVRSKQRFFSVKIFWLFTPKKFVANNSHVSRI